MVEIEPAGDTDNSNFTFTEKEFQRILAMIDGQVFPFNAHLLANNELWQVTDPEVAEQIDILGHFQNSVLVQYVVRVLEHPTSAAENFQVSMCWGDDGVDFVTWNKATLLAGGILPSPYAGVPIAHVDTPRMTYKYVPGSTPPVGPSLYLHLKALWWAPF